MSQPDNPSLALDPYLFFGGRCEEALEFYRDALGAEIRMKLRFDESPDATPPGMLAEGFEKKIMHSEMRVAGRTVMASDGCGPGGPFQGISLALTLPTRAEVDRAFEKLADGGKVDMPLMQTFWSPRYGMVTDRFGLQWMVMQPGAAPN
jgi:PhnB protein